MDAIDRYEQLVKINNWLHQHMVKPEPAYFFLEDAETEYSEAESFCWDCIHELVPHAVMGEHFGGGYSFEEESCEVCEHCGKLLQYNLTDEGMDSELDHFIEYPPDKLTPQICYELSKIADAIWKEDNERISRFLSIQLPEIDFDETEQE